MDDPSEIIGEINSAIIEIQEMGEVTEFSHIEKIDSFIHTLDNKVELDLLESGVKAIDDFIYGWEPGELIILAGAASMGKTALALEIFKNAIFKGYKPAFFSLY